MNMKSIAAILGFVAVALGPIPSSLFPGTGIDAAFAEKNKGNSGGDKSKTSKTESKAESKENKAKTKADKSRAKADRKAKGGLASELKGLNAVKANPNAFKNAAPNSQVGRIASYRDAAIATSTAAGLLASATAARDALPTPTRTVAAIDMELAGLDPDLVGYFEAAAALELERQAVVKYDAANATVTAANTVFLSAQSTENTALLTASGGRVLSPEAIAYVRDELGL